jgi:ribosome biogenesis GTPase
VTLAAGEAASPDTTVITSVLPRRSAFVRSAADASRRSAGNLVDEQVLAANVDVAFLVAGLDHDFNLRRLERYLAVAWSSGVRPIVVLNKADVAIDLEQRLPRSRVDRTGRADRRLSARTGEHVADLAAFLSPGQTAVVLGSSGVGKSTLVNALLGEQRQTTAAVRADDSRGRHTTTHRELFELPGGAFLIDTPGIRSLEIAGADEGIDTAFDDIARARRLVPLQRLRHRGEPGCAVQAAIDDGRLGRDRFASHEKLGRELAYSERKGDARADAEYRKRWRNVHKEVARHMREKYGKPSDDDARTRGRGRRLARHRRRSTDRRPPFPTPAWHRRGL